MMRLMDSGTCAKRFEMPRGVTMGTRGAQFLGPEITEKDAEKGQNVTSTFFKTVHLFPKDLRFEHGGAKVASFPGAI